MAAKENGYAVGKYNLNNLEFPQAILQASQEENAPVIFGVSEVAARYMGGFYTVVKMGEGLMHDYNITIPVAIHFDHGSSFDNWKEAIGAGFPSIMIYATNFLFFNTLMPPRAP
ncbi:class II fructose-bisphosphate aldolase, partial [Staphylococcus hyicus]